MGLCYCLLEDDMLVIGQHLNKRGDVFGAECISCQKDA